MDDTYPCMSILKITDELISKTKDHVTNIILLLRELKLPVTPSAHLFCRPHYLSNKKFKRIKMKIMLKELIKMGNVMKKYIV